MLNVLINAYAISPNWGSEQGVGWNWVVNIARYCNCHIITESEYEAEIKESVEMLPNKNNLHFYFNPVTPEVRRMCWNQGDWRFYIHYEKWQKRTLKIAKDICSKVKIDVIHQQNMVSFREPGYLWEIEEIPFVWGPIGGMNRLPMTLAKGMTIKKKLFYLVKNTISLLQSRYKPRVLKAVKHSDVIIAATKTVYDCMVGYHKHQNVVFVNETGLDLSKVESVKHDYNHETLELLWVGRFLVTKRLDIALQSIAKCTQKVHLTIVGTGSDAEFAHYHNMASSLGIDDKVTWLGSVKHDEVERLMREKDVFFFTSTVEATSTVVPEAMSNNLPVISFNACGFGHLVKDKVGETIELQAPDKASVTFAELIDKLSKDKRPLARYSEDCDKYKKELAWQWKAERVLELYQEAIDKHRNL